MDLYEIEMASGVGSLASHTHVNVVREIGVEDTWVVAAGVCFFDLIGVWIRRHDTS